MYWLPYSSHTSHNPSQTFLEFLMPLKNWCSIHEIWSKSSLEHSIRFWDFFPSLKHNFIAYRSSKVSDCNKNNILNFQNIKCLFKNVWKLIECPTYEQNVSELSPYQAAVSLSQWSVVLPYTHKVSSMLYVNLIFTLLKKHTCESISLFPSLVQGSFFRSHMSTPQNLSPHYQLSFNIWIILLLILFPSWPIPSKTLSLLKSFSINSIPCCFLLPQQWNFVPATKRGRLVASIQLLVQLLQLGFVPLLSYHASFYHLPSKGTTLFSSRDSDIKIYIHPKLKQNFTFFKVWFFFPMKSACPWPIDFSWPFISSSSFV